VRLEASTKPHVHDLIHEFFINMTFTKACPNFKKGLKMVSGPLGVNVLPNRIEFQGNLNLGFFTGKMLPHPFIPGAGV
jgi:hypothetical protein